MQRPQQLTMWQDAVQAEQDGLRKAFAEWEALPDKIGAYLTHVRRGIR